MEPKAVQPPIDCAALTEGQLLLRSPTIALKIHKTATTASLVEQVDTNSEHRMTALESFQGSKSASYLAALQDWQTRCVVRMHSILPS
jgi:hypothetical protein